MEIAVLCIRENIFGNSIGNCGSLHEREYVWQLEWKLRFSASENSQRR